MMILGFIVLVLAVLIGLFALRGRVVQTGEFCRGCRFDLVGSPLDESSKCPECGRSIHDPASRRTTLRRRSTLGLVASLTLFLAGTGSLGFGIWGNPAKFYAQLPDSAVVQGVQWGSSAALDEATSRLAISPKFAKKYHNDLINHALQVQADRLQPWDPRLGQILLDALMNGLFNQEQFDSYALNGWAHTLDLRDKVHAGESMIQYRLESSGDRVSAFGYTLTEYRYGARLIEYGVVDQSHIWKINRARRLGGRLYIGGGGLGSTIASSLWGMDKHTTQTEIGDSIPIYIDLEIRLEHPDYEEPIVSKVIRLEQSVLVVSPDEPIVKLIKNADYTDQLVSAITLGPLHTMKEPTPSGPNHYNIILKQLAMIDAIPISVSFRVYYRIGDEEVHIGKLVREGPMEEPRGKYLQWGVNPKDPQVLEHALTLHEIALDQGKVDVIFRTDPGAALEIPAIDEVIYATIEFADVPIKIVEIPQEVNNPDWDEIRIVGELIAD
ncbi:MAG: hypothetical protein AB8C13_05045 [Phycisphaerales bacterium]